MEAVFLLQRESGGEFAIVTKYGGTNPAQQETAGTFCRSARRRRCSSAAASLCARAPLNSRAAADTSSAAAASCRTSDRIQRIREFGQNTDVDCTNVCILQLGHKARLARQCRPQPAACRHRRSLPQCPPGSAAVPPAALSIVPQNGTMYATLWPAYTPKHPKAVAHLQLQHAALCVIYPLQSSLSAGILLYPCAGSLDCLQTTGGTVVAGSSGRYASAAMCDVPPFGVTPCLPSRKRSSPTATPALPRLHCICTAAASCVRNRPYQAALRT